MANAKLYLYYLEFIPGTIGEPKPNYVMGVVLRKAVGMPKYRIELRASEDPDDPKDEGCAQGRLEFLRRRFLDVRVDANRLELSTNTCIRKAPGAEIRLFPWVASLSDEGHPFLNQEEIRMLQWARDAVLLTPDEFTKEKRESLERYSATEWKRILGTESLEEWARAGAKHPYFD